MHRVEYAPIVLTLPEIDQAPPMLFRGVAIALGFMIPVYVTVGLVLAIWL